MTFVRASFRFGMVQALPETSSAMLAMSDTLGNFSAIATGKVMTDRRAVEVCFGF